MKECEHSAFNDVQSNARLYGGMPVAIFGIFTNIINVIVFLDPEMRCSLVNHFLFVLSISDFLLLLCNFFMLIFPVIASTSHNIALHNSYPVILWHSYPIGLVTQTCGVYLTVLVSVHRYLGVCHPFRAKRWVSGKPVKCAIIGSIVFSILINIHYWLELELVDCYSKEFNAVLTSISLTPLKMNHTYNLITKCFLYTLVMFVIPFFLLILVNTRIIVALRESTRMRTGFSAKKTNPSQLKNPSLLKTNGNSVRDRSVTMMLLAIVGIFLVCNCPAFANNIYEILNQAQQKNDTISQPPQRNETAPLAGEESSSSYTFDFSVELSNILVSLNSSSSMFVYLIFSSKYRSIIKHWLGLEKRKKVNGVALTTAVVVQKALALSILPDEVEARRARRERVRLFTKKAEDIRRVSMTGSEQDLASRAAEVEFPAADVIINRDDSHRSSSRRKLLRFATIQ